MLSSFMSAGWSHARLTHYNIRVIIYDVVVGCLADLILFSTSHYRIAIVR
jgi:hypothetical protein